MDTLGEVVGNGLLILLCLGVVVAVIRHLTRDKADVKAMTCEQLQIENYWEVAGGNYPNIYSRELERRGNVDAFGMPL